MLLVYQVQVADLETFRLTGYKDSWSGGRGADRSQGFLARGETDRQPMEPHQLSTQVANSYFFVTQMANKEILSVTQGAKQSYFVFQCGVGGGWEGDGRGGGHRKLYG